MTKQIAVWIDHKQARIFTLDPEHTDEVTLLAPLQSLHHKHPRGPEGPREHPNDAKRFFDEVVLHLEGADQVLIVGPGSAKLEFQKYVHAHARAGLPSVAGVETVDHPTDGQVAAYARTYFARRDREARKERLS